MLLLAYRNLRTRPARTLFTALAIALGVGMIFAMRLVGVTIEESARVAREGRLSGADLEVTGANGVNPADAMRAKGTRPAPRLRQPAIKKGKMAAAPA